MAEKINNKKKYNLPEEVIFCTKCVISNQRPRITFNEKGVCSACQFAEDKKNSIDWAIKGGHLSPLGYRKIANAVSQQN